MGFLRSIAFRVFPLSRRRIFLALPVALCLLLQAPVSPETAGQGVPVRFLQPRTSHLAGPHKILVRVDPPAGDRVKRLDLFIDGELAYRAEHPPFTFQHDFGATEGPHHLEAFAQTRNGRTGRAELQSRVAPLVRRVEVQLVQLPATVFDLNDRFVSFLGRNDFTILENGVEQKIAFFDPAGAPRSVALVLDCSGSMKRRLPKVRHAAMKFLKVLPENFEITILGFNRTVFVAQDFTRDRRLLSEALHRLRAGGSTGLYEALRRVSLQLEGSPDPKAVVLFTDGRESYYGEDPSGEAALRELLEIAGRAGVVFFPIGYGADGTSPLLARIAKETGGKFYFAPSGLPLRRVLNDIAGTLESQYTLAYYPEPSPSPGEWRSVEIQVKREGYQVLTRKGYSAPGPESLRRR